jgi:outer membrane protein insertion porin family
LKDLEWVSLFDTRVKGEGIKYLHDLPNLSLLDITFDYLHKPSPGQRPTLREVCKFSHLKRLSIRGKGIVDDDLACLVGMNIEHLELGFPVGDRGAEYISKIASLKMLDCRSLMSEDNWIISDVGLERLSHLSHLEHMQITGTFTDKGMEHLARLKSLEYLYLGSPNVTADGLTALASKLPCLQEARRQGEAIPIPDFVTSKKDSIRRHKGQLRVDEDELEDHAPPAWQLTAWVNATPKQFSPENLRGKVVLVDFWFTACKPCRAMMPRLKELHNKYQAQGLVVLGIHMSDGAQKMPEYVAKEQIPWPTAADVDNATVKAWEVDGYPGIYLIDRSGKLRVAGVYQDDLEKAVAKLLEEKTPPAVAPGDNQGSSKVLDVRILGNQSVPLDKIRRNIHTRPNRPFDPEMIKEDVRRLENARLFVDVKTYFQQVNGGRIVFFEVLERPLLKEVLFVGCAEVHKKVLQKEAHIKEGDAADPLVIEEARGKLEDFYQKKGFTTAKVTLLEGDKPQDRRAVFLINEDVKQKVWDVKFVGNTIASDDRLKTQIKSKSSFPNTFGNEIDHKSQERLTAYYRGLGFFHARISEPVFDYNEKNDLVTITFVIDEGVRFTIRNVSIIGNTKFTAAELLSELKLKSSEYFNQEQMAADIRILQDKYGSSGYVFADVKADPQFLETTGQPNPLHDRYGLSGSVEPIVLVRGYLCQLDLIYQIKEGHRCRVGKIDVTVKGEYPHAQMTTILNQLSFKHGDVIDIRKIRDCETRIRASGLFENRPDGASRPKIVFSPSVQDGREPGDQTVDVTVDCGRYIGPATP